MINVSWRDAKAYAEWLSRDTGQPYRLPSEAEWEYACRAGTTAPFSFGRTISPSQANYDGNYTYANGAKGVYREKTVAVGSLPGNSWGLHEMHGNVWEWVEDIWHDDYSGAPIDGSAWTDREGRDSGSRRVVRGGSWVNDPGLCRSAFRNRGGPDGRLRWLGFRLARSLDPRGKEVKIQVLRKRQPSTKSTRGFYDYFGAPDEGSAWTAKGTDTSGIRP